MNLFLFSHQDDEYGVYPVLESLVAQGQQVEVAYLTSGTIDGRRSERRNSESTRVLTAIGLAESQIHFLGSDLNLPDGKLFQKLEQAAEAVIGTVANRQLPTRIFTPAWEGGHQDHDATYIVACYLARQFSCLNSSRQFPLYHGHGLPGILWHTLSPLRDNGPVESCRITWRARLRYLGYCLCYRSQWLTWLGLYPMYALNLLISGKQHLQPLLLSRLSTAPHQGPRLYERRGFCTADQFVYHTKSLVDKIIS